MSRCHCRDCRFYKRNKRLPFPACDNKESENYKGIMSEHETCEHSELKEKESGK